MGKFSTRDIIVSVSGNGRIEAFYDLHFECEVIKTLAGIPNTCKIKIFNINKTRRDFLTSIYDEEMSKFTVTLNLDGVDYFIGDLVNVTSVFNTPTWETVLYCAEGYNAQRKVATIETKKGDTRKSILDTMIGTLSDTGLNVVDIQALKNQCGNKSILKRLIYDGNVWENLKKLVRDCLPESDIYIEGNAVKILDKGEILEQFDTPLNSFLAPPTLNEQGCTVSIILNSDIKIGGTITLFSKSYNQAFGNLTTNRARNKSFSGEGTYKVIELQHTFDNYTSAVAKTEITGVII